MGPKETKVMSGLHAVHNPTIFIRWNSLEMEEEMEKLRYGYRPQSVVFFLFERYYDSII